MPIINASGYGNIVNHIDEHLTDICRSHNPLTVIVTVDFADILRQKIFNTCAELKTAMDNRITAWLQSAATDSRFVSLPELIVTVIQIRKFESWLISDVASLKREGVVSVDIPAVNDADAIPDPASWLRQAMGRKSYRKDPLVAKTIIGCLNPAVMRINSRSFDKFYREVRGSYERWSERCAEASTVA